MTKPPRKPTSGTRHGSGAGWGGPAKGPSTAPTSIQTAPQFQPGVSPNPGGVLGERKAALLEKAFSTLDKAMDAPDIRTAAQAATNVVAALHPRPAQTNINLSGDDIERLSERELADEQARIDAALAADQAGDVAAAVPAKPGRLVH